MYHCTPDQLDAQEFGIVQVHQGFLGLDAREAEYDARRAEQAAKNKI